MGVPVLAPADLAELARSGHPSALHAALVLRPQGSRGHAGRPAPGAVGGRIVGEVFIGLLQTDPSPTSTRTGLGPTLPTKTGNPQEFRMIDFLTFAGVDPASRGQSRRKRRRPHFPWRKGRSGRRFCHCTGTACTSSRTARAEERPHPGVRVGEGPGSRSIHDVLVGSPPPDRQHSSRTRGPVLGGSSVQRSPPFFQLPRRLAATASRLSSPRCLAASRRRLLVLLPVRLAALCRPSSCSPFGCRSVEDRFDGIWAGEVAAVSGWRSWG